MQRTEVKSSNIKSIGYGPDESGVDCLEVEFHPPKRSRKNPNPQSAIWQYQFVPRSEYEEIMAASSIGMAFRALILEGVKQRRYGPRLIFPEVKR